MGANEKFDATYHGREYTLFQGNLIRVNDGKGNELFSILSDGTVQGELEHASQAAKIFMSELRGLAEIIRAEAKAEALREAAISMMDERIESETEASNWLDNRANQHKEAPSA